MAVKWIKVSRMENKFLVEKSRVRRYFEEEIRPLSYFRRLSYRSSNFPTSKNRLSSTIYFGQIANEISNFEYLNENLEI